MKIKTFIVEDEINARQVLTNMLNFYCSDIEIIGEAKNVAESVELIKSKKPDLVLLDVRLPDGTGFDLLDQIKNQKFKLIFITAYNEYALKAIKLSAIDYLLKPVKPEELRKAISKVEQAIENDEMLNVQVDTMIDNMNPKNKHQKIILNTNENIYVLEIGKLIRIESNINYSIVYSEGKDKIFVAKTLKEFEEMLVPFGFFRIHQSHLVNTHFVDSYEKKAGGRAILHDGTSIPVSVRRKEGFIKALSS